MKKIILITTLIVLSVATFSQSVYVTKTGTKYHLAGCSYLSNSAIEYNLNDAVAAGYKPCSVCKPSASASTPQSTTDQAPAKTSTTAKQCSATTQSGNRCSRTTTNASGKCWQHDK